MNKTLILASSSPRRVELLKNAGFTFTVMPANIDETVIPGETPSACAKRLSETKAFTVAKKMTQEALIVAADTLIGFRNTILGKPESPDHAFRILKELLGHTHEVLTAYCIVCGHDIIKQDVVISTVTMRQASDQEIRDYIATGEPMDKAGAYALQGIGKKFVEKVEGSANNVIGLPIEEITPVLKQHVL